MKSNLSRKLRSQVWSIISSLVPVIITIECGIIETNYFLLNNTPESYIRTFPKLTIPHRITTTRTIPHQDDSPLAWLGQLPRFATSHQDRSPLGWLTTRMNLELSRWGFNWWGVVLLESYPDGELSWWGFVLHVVGSYPDEVLSWWGVFLVGSCPSGELSWWGIVLVGSYPDGVLSWWGVVLHVVGSYPDRELSWWAVVLYSGESSKWGVVSVGNCPGGWGVIRVGVV